MQDDGLKRLPAAFYQASNGTEPVRAWLKELPATHRRVIGIDVATVEFGWPVGMPLCRNLGHGLWEIRSHLPNGTIARIFFCIAGRRMVLLHGFIKKTQRIPARDLDLARKRRKEIAP